MATIEIDCYGRTTNDDWYRDFNHKPAAYIVDKATANTTYICFSTGAKRCIHRLVEANNVLTVTWDFGAWANRASLPYQKAGGVDRTLNDAATIDKADL